MSTATQKTGHATIASYTVAAGQTATLGRGVILSGADDEVATAGVASDLVIGVFKETAAAAARVEVYLFGPVIRVEVGAGGATRGNKSEVIATGLFQDAPAHDSSGASNDQIYGIFMQSGVSGDYVGMMLAPSNRGSA